MAIFLKAIVVCTSSNLQTERRSLLSGWYVMNGMILDWLGGIYSLPEFNKIEYNKYSISLFEIKNKTGKVQGECMV